MTAPPLVSVVVPVYGDRGELQACLDALLRQDHDAYEVVLVDNGGNAASPVLNGAAASSPGPVPVRVVREPARGSYAARNAGVAASRGQVLAFTDADCLPRPDWLSRGVERLLAAPAPAFVGGRIQLFAARPGRPTSAELFELAEGFPQESYVRQQGFAATANLLVTRETFEQVGRFRPELRSGGDREWGTRASGLGVHGVFADDVVVDHPCRPTVRELRRKVVRVTRGDLDVRRIQGRRAVELGDLRAWLRPPVRSTRRASARVRGQGRLPRARYAAVALYLHQLELAVRLSLSLRAVSAGRDRG